MNLADIWTVIWKDIRELPKIYGSSKMSLIGLFFPVFIIGILFPIQMGEKWLHPALVLIMGTLFAVTMVFATVADSFAGERERKTLETLLSSRLSDRSILFGKLLSSICFAVAFVYLLFLVGLITLNLTRLGGGRFLFFEGRVFAALLVLPLCSSFAASGVGVLVSLRASSVKQAQQGLVMSVMLLFFLPAMLIPMLPKSILERLTGIVTMVGPEVLVILAVIVLLTVGTVSVALAMRVFQRARLILD